MVQHKLVPWMNKDPILNMLVLGVNHMTPQNMKVQLEQVHMRVLGQVGNKKVRRMKVVL